MNESAVRDVERLRDVERWKDQIEVRLDNRQVFFLFFGSAVVACMLFVLGVIVGKRIESRGRADALEVQDPLAALDRAHQPPLVAGPAAPPVELTFPKALARPGASTARVTASAPKLIAGLPKPAAAPKTVAAPKAVTAGPKLVAAAPRPVVAAPKAPVAAAAPADATKTKGKYTLQLSAFPTREEADTFAEKYEGTFVLPTEIPGKGTWYRVRCGNFASYQEASAAKAAFERQNRIIALVSAR